MPPKLRDLCSLEPTLLVSCFLLTEVLMAFLVNQCCVHRYNFVELLNSFPLLPASSAQNQHNLPAPNVARHIPSASILLHSSFFFCSFPTHEILIRHPPPPNTSNFPTTSHFFSHSCSKGPLPTERAEHTFAYCSYFLLWTRNPSPGCKPPQCSASADRHSRRWHRAVRSPLRPRLGSGPSSSAGTSPTGWQWDQRLPPHSASHLHKNLLLKLKEGDLIKHCFSKLASSRGMRGISGRCSDTKDGADTGTLPALLWENGQDLTHPILSSHIS